MPTERDRMLAGALYNAADPDLSAERHRTRLLLRQLNRSRDGDRRREDILRQLFAASAHLPVVEPPFFCDYGANIRFGENVYFNFGCTLLDVCRIEIGSHCLFGPSVQIYAATHPLDWQVRASGLENGKPIAIGDHVWVGGGAILLPGVTIGARSVIGAGAVVTRDVPPDVLVAGNPARVIRKLGEQA